MIGEDIAHGDEFRILVGSERLFGCAGTASAATDETDAENIAAGGMNVRRQRGQCRGGSGRAGEEIAPRGGVRRG